MTPGRKAVFCMGFSAPASLFSQNQKSPASQIVV
jgi:hypothetical protein